MKRVGEVVRVAGGVAVVRCPDAAHPDIGTDVIDDSLAAVGRVVDVFGPVDRPYLAVSADDDRHLPGLIGSPLYAES